MGPVRVPGPSHVFAEEVRVTESRKNEFQVRPVPPLEGCIQPSGFCVSSVLWMTGTRKVGDKESGGRGKWRTSTVLSLSRAAFSNQWQSTRPLSRKELAVPMVSEGPWPPVPGFRPAGLDCFLRAGPRKVSTQWERCTGVQCASQVPVNCAPSTLALLSLRGLSGAQTWWDADP